MVFLVTGSRCGIDGFWVILRTLHSGTSSSRLRRARRSWQRSRFKRSFMPLSPQWRKARSSRFLSANVSAIVAKHRHVTRNENGQFEYEVASIEQYHDSTSKEIERLRCRSHGDLHRHSGKKRLGVLSQHQDDWLGSLVFQAAPELSETVF